ncbi:aminoacylase [candidate division BRC1 bacterium HGW-BRC1-1]|jgi:N-acyl-D-amino-acid deacylase|nr:MAG: aminoacylase [candidate division BRC1 bacterium HGW-BRC1-1]
MKPSALFILASCLAAISLPAVAQDAAPRYDMIIRNGRIIDGAGNAWYRGDVAVRDGAIAAVGTLSTSATAEREVDAADRYIAPGFIDVHTHCEGDIEKRPEAENFVRMGVTSVVTGNCGGSYLNLDEAFTSMTTTGIGVNVASLVGHNSVRSKVMGNSSQDPTTTEIQAMQGLVERAMRDGAVGLSTGLIYIPGSYSKTGEIVELARVVAKYKGLYASHMRNEGSEVLEAIEEALTVGREAGVPVEISHFKIIAPLLHGQSTRTLGMVENARAAGQDVTIDQYVYTASSTGLNSILPDWVADVSREELYARLRDPATRKRVVDELVSERRDKAGRKDMSYAHVANFRADPSMNGKNLLEITRMMRPGDESWDAQIETALDLITSGGASMVFHSIDEGDVQRILSYPYNMVASDSGIREFGAGVPHPRGYGNNARVLSRYVREKGLLRLEDAVRKMTSLPAQRFGFTNRGILRPGMAADVVVFDLAKVSDESTFEKPHAWSKGFDLVLVNGVAVLDNDTMTGRLPGKVLRGAGAVAAQP